MKSGGDEQSRIEDIKKRINKRGSFSSDVSRPSFSPAKETVGRDWRRPEKIEKLEAETQKDIRDNNGNGESKKVQAVVLNEVVGKKYKISPFLKKMLVFATIFFALVVLASIFIVLSGRSIVSSKNVSVEISGPISAKGGDDMSFIVSIANKNSVPIESVELKVEFPDGTRSAKDVQIPLTRLIEKIGQIGSGEVVNKEVGAILFGESGSIAKMMITVEYRTDGSNAILYKDRKYEVAIDSAPLNLTVSLPEDINSGALIDVGVTISGAGTEVVERILVEVLYPSGFIFNSATPSPTYGNNVWKLGDIQAGSEREINIKGTLEGQNNEEKLFKVVAGVASAEREDKIDIPYVSTLETLEIKRLFVDLDFILSGDRSREFISSPGERIRGDITWKNNLSDKILNGVLTVKIIGKSLNESDVSLPRGFYNSADDVIIWDSRHIPELAVLDPGASGNVSFDISSLTLSTLRSMGLTNQELSLVASFKGTRVIDGKTGDQVVTNTDKIIKLRSLAGLTTRALSSVGPFGNTGPLPPRVGQETTYTVALSITNSTNEIDDVVVKTSLPSYVRWINNFTPATEDVNYNAVNGDLTWRVGRVGYNVTGAPIKVLTFQLGFTPSANQVGASPNLTGQIGMSGHDTFTNTLISGSYPSLDINITTDPIFNDAIVRVAP